VRTAGSRHVLARLGQFAEDRSHLLAYLLARLGRFAEDRGKCWVVDLVVGERQELQIVPGRKLAQLGKRKRSLAVALDLLAHPLGHRREHLLGHGRTGPGGLSPDLGQVPHIGAALDLAQRATPVGVVGTELLLEGREPVAQRRITNLELCDVADLPLDIGVQEAGRLLLDTQKILLVQDLHAVERGVERVEQRLDHLRFPGLRLPRLGRHVLGG
jgi:hypothetical protein